MCDTSDFNENTFLPYPAKLSAQSRQGITAGLPPALLLLGGLGHGLVEDAGRAPTNVTVGYCR